MYHFIPCWLNLCLRKENTVERHGESSRTKEHMDWFVSKKEDNPMFKHQSNFHPGLEPNYTITMTALKFFKNPLTRQLNEGVRINNTRSSPGLLMNSKTEFRQREVAR